MERRGKVAKVKKVYSLDEEIADLIERYSDELHLSASGFVSLMVTQIDQVLRVTTGDEEKREADKSGED